jgi:hypothetical protein
MRRLLFTVCALAAASSLLAGCGGGSTDAAARTEAAASHRSDQGMVQFARCMRQNGVNMPDPVHRPGHDGLSIDLPERGPATTDAYRACGHFMQATIELKQRAAARSITPAVRLGLIHYAGCMRGHGISMLDPDALGQLTLGNVAGMGNGFGRYTPQFHSADQSCRHLLPATISDDGTGP